MAENMIFSKTTEGGRPSLSNNTDWMDSKFNDELLTLPEAYKGVNDTPDKFQPSSMSQIGLSTFNATNERSDSTSVVEHIVDNMFRNKSLELKARKKMRDTVLRNIGPKIRKILASLENFLPSQIPSTSEDEQLDAIEMLESPSEDIFPEPDVSRVDIDMKSHVEPRAVQQSYPKYLSGSDKVRKNEIASVLEAIKMVKSEPKMLRPTNWNLMSE